MCSFNILHPKEIGSNEYSIDHDKTLDDQVNVFGYKHVNAMITKDEKIIDVDIVDKDNKYITTVRMNNNGGNTQYSNFVRKGVKVGDVIPTNLDSSYPTMGEAQIRNDQHFIDNPVTE